MNIIEENKRFFGIASDCYSCVINQARTAAGLAALDEEQTSRVVAVAEAGLERSKTTPLLVQHIIRNVADAIIQESGESPEFDIYAEVKEQSNTLSLNYVKLLQKKIDGSALPFETGLQIAAAGNIIDFGAKNHVSLNLAKELELLTTISFTRYDVEPFKKALDTASTLLYICDNCGEIVFDMLFIKQLLHTYPGLQIVAAVRDKPIINDATLEDAKVVGLDRLVTTISSGSIYPGTILSETSEEFQKLFKSADLILAKGQGNFETLLPLADKKLYFLLRIKCEYMASLAQVDKDSLVLMQG
ncbi:MAG: DUF89 family protein [Deltaproteobacteria bacterium]|jgi:hypothetical protein|nr:DUF89 family protein [Deltaproteobacteria bacterium]